jgi:hypothetical protein
MILIPVCLLASFPPGFLFPQMAERMSVNFVKSWKERKAAKEAEKNGGNSTDGHEAKATPEAKAAPAAKSVLAPMSEGETTREASS